MPANPRCQIRTPLSWRKRPCGSHLLQPQHQWARRHLATRACAAAPTLCCAPRPTAAAALLRASISYWQDASTRTCTGGCARAQTQCALRLVPAGSLCNVRALCAGTPDQACPRHACTRRAGDTIKSTIKPNQTHLQTPWGRTRDPTRVRCKKKAP